MNIWQYQRKVSRRLLRWAGFSIAGGLAIRGGGSFGQSLGGQFIMWGVINAAIALFGNIATQQRIASIENPGALSVRQRENRNLRRLLWINAGLDILYVLFGRRLASRQTDNARGHGLGIIIQGAFLFFFDLFHALDMPEEYD